MTPALLRYKQLKEQNPQALLLYRMGDFYECFYEDAVTISKVLDIALTSRDKGPNKTPMAGIPYHALETYLGKLIDSGFKVAVAEQEESKVQDEKSGKTKIIINRNISRIITPSTYERELDYNSHFLTSIVVENPRNFLHSEFSQKQNIVLSCIDPNGSQFWVMHFDNIASLDNELHRVNPSEILITKDLFQNILSSNFVSKSSHIITVVEDSIFSSSENLLDHLKLTSLKSCGLDDELEYKAAYACFNYLSSTQNSKLDHIISLQKRVPDNKMRIDNTTLRNLEIINTNNSSGKSLLNILDFTHTRGGKRLLKDWVSTPLMNAALIKERLNAIKELKTVDMTQINILLDKIYDLERLCARISFGTVSPRDLVTLGQSIRNALEIAENYIANVKAKNLKEVYKTISGSCRTLEKLLELLERTLIDPAPAQTKDGHVIKDGFSKELDELRSLTTDNKKWLRNLEIMEQQKTGISTLKVKYNRVFGYFIEVSKAQISKVPDTYIRKQTTVNGERYITTELKEKESMILGAADRIVEFEQELYKNLVNDVKAYIVDILSLQKALSELDIYLSFTTAAELNNYCEPIFNFENEIHVIDARHPVIEQITKENYIFNDIHLKDGEMLLITGPNMGGKSTYIRMTAMIAYMAHIGSFVPASECSMCIVDSVFTRVGASDDLSKGESTFMVEMTEAANILKNATKKSLIILDEIGRGTSTYDGLSIAWSIVFYIHEVLKAKTLFATHYHELTVLEDELKRFSNYTVAISEDNGDVVFLRRIEKGKAERSFGIHVAKLAGLPQKVLDKAQEILQELEAKALSQSERQYSLWELAMPKKQEAKQNIIKNVEYDKLIQEIKEIDVDNLTPMEALTKLNELKKKI